MDIHLTPELEQKIQKKISSGIYGNISEVISEALHLLDERDMIKNRDFNLLKQDINDGYKSGGRHMLDVNKLIIQKTNKNPQ